MTFDPADASALARFVRSEGRGVVATVSPLGAPEAALVGVAALPDGTLIFDSRADARKVANLAHDSRIAVVIGTDGDVSVQVEGVATIAVDEARERFGSAYNEQFPGSRALDPDFVVVAIRPEWIRVYDASVSPTAVAESRW